MLKRIGIFVALLGVLAVVSCDYHEEAVVAQRENIALHRPDGKHVLTCIGTTSGDASGKQVVMDCFEVTK